MAGFAGWLHEVNEPNDAALAALKTFAAAQGTQWPYWSDTPKSYIELIAKAAPESDRSGLTATLSTYYARWKSESKSSWLRVDIGKLVLVFFGIVFVGLLYKGIGIPLDNADQVRGMVTFFFVLVTTSIILLVALGIFWLQDDNAVKIRFESAKDLLTLVIGVLGTIMGFYFGSATSGTANLALLSTSLTPPTIAAGQTATLVSTINGGARPYKYSAVFTDQNGAQVKALNVALTDSPDGKIDRKIEVPKDAKPGVVFFTLTATDKNSVSTQGGGALFVQQPAQPAPTPTPTPGQ